jgi:outer membrane receptor protein involved in Fe transport
MNRNSEIASAVGRALAMSAAATAAVHSAPAAAQDQTADESTQTVTVTGSRIRRVDLETAAPVFVLDASQIQNSGVSTVGDLIQRIPAISGAATNPNVNNGGGFGESNVELRGLGAQRTLVLLNGRRIGILGNTTTSAVDINMVPLNLIERVEILKEGAGAVYGSDAIAGVVNFITRKDWDGADVSVEYGRTSHDDGARRTASLSLGSTGDRLSILIGANYNKQEAVSAGNRDFSKFALYLYQTSKGAPSVQAGGSSRTATGRVNLPAPLLAQYGPCKSNSVTRIDGAAGTKPSDYRCFVTANDLYNYQPLNLLTTPQERASIFTLANYKINDSIEAYTELLYNHTRSGFQIAALPLDTRNDDLVVAADNYYNPFGIAFGGLSAVNPNAQYRLEALGTRHSQTQTDQTLGTGGLKGEIFNSGWQWDLSAGFGHMQQDANISGYLLKSKVAPTLGPSGLSPLDYTTVVCGTPTPDAASPNGLSVSAANLISGCTPLDIFNLTAPGQAEALGKISTNYQQNYHYRSQDYSLNVNGKLFDLPAGELSAAFGAEYRNLEGEFGTDVLSRGIAPLFLTCELAQETCTGDSYAQYIVKEVYGEFLIPLLKDKPGVQSLNLTAGVRYSDYSKDTIGNTTNSEFKLEYRPISDLMVRASWAEVFRAPTIVDLSLAPSLSADTFTDPCEGLDATKMAQNPNLAKACQFVATDGSYPGPSNGQINGLLIGNENLKPETGSVLTYGIVYDVSQVRGLSFTVDFWKYKIDDIITNLDPNFTADQCAASGQAQFCDLIFRFDTTTSSPGDIIEIQRPTVNLGTLKTNGVDFGVKYQLRNTPAGSFNFSLDMTHIGSYESVPAPGAATIEVAGTYDRQYGNFAKLRGLLGIGWTYQGLDALLTTRYIGDEKLLNPRGGTAESPSLRIPSFVYVDASIAYELPSKTRIQFGALNLADKQPPLLYQNNVINANTDVSTYDTIGRQWFVGVSQKF